MVKSANLAAWLRRGLTGWLLASVAAVASAGPTWMESNGLTSSLDNNFTYTADAATRTATVTYHDQQATNTSGGSGHFGMYLGWMWSYDSTGAATSLLWSNADQAFVGGGIKMSIAGGTGSVKLGDIVNDTWIGTPWTPGAPAAGITTQADWVVPLFDFGYMAAGATVLYDMAITLTFNDQAAFDDWNRAGSFYIGAQAVAAMPEPGSLALVALALAAVGLGVRLRSRR